LKHILLLELQKNRVILLIVAICFYVLVSVSVAFASVGAGVGIGQIVVKERLVPGGVYQLPLWVVLNTGDSDGIYHLTVDGLNSDWISFSQNDFKLGSHDSRFVTVQLVLPGTADKGVYNVYLENHLVTTGPVGVGPVAATKLRFTVGDNPGVLGAATQRVYSWFILNRRAALFVFLLLDLLIVYWIIKKYFKISFKVEGRRRKNKL